MLLEGLFLPLTTPFLPDGRLNARKLEDNVARYSKTPASGLAVLAPVGQPSLLSDVETREILRTVALSAAAEKVLIAGVARDSVLGTLDLIEYAANFGFDAALMPVPSIFRQGTSDAKARSTFFQTVADKSALPVLLDGGTAGEMTVELAIELARHPNLIGMVLSTPDGVQLAEVVRGTTAVRRDVTVTNVFAAVTGRMLQKQEPAEAVLLPAGSLTVGGTALSAAPSGNRFKTRTKSVGFQVLCGRTVNILDFLAAGATGAMVPLAAAAPQACYEVLAAWKDGDPALAAEKQERLHAVAERIEEDFGVAGIKFACDLNGYFGGRPRLPWLPLTGADRDEIEQLMRSIRN